MKAEAEAIQRVGGEVVPAIMYGLIDLHTDEFFADRAREMASWEGVNTIYVEDAPGVLTPERAATLLPALQEATPAASASSCTATTPPAWRRSATSRG